MTTRRRMIICYKGTGGTISKKSVSMAKEKLQFNEWFVSCLEFKQKKGEELERTRERRQGTADKKKER